MEKGDAWEEVGALKQARVVHRMVAIGKNQLLILGGSSKGSPSADVEMVEVRK
jgi:hypothetical protein